MTVQSKEDVTALILSAKRQTGMTWEEIAGKIGMSPVWTHSACMGIKALIHEKFGDGIMSAIDFDMSVTRVENPKGDRVKIEMSGKYLGYNSW